MFSGHLNHCISINFICSYANEQIRYVFLSLNIRYLAFSSADSSRNPKIQDSIGERPDIFLSQQRQLYLDVNRRAPNPYELDWVINRRSFSPDSTKMAALIEFEEQFEYSRATNLKRSHRLKSEGLLDCYFIRKRREKEIIEYNFSTKWKSESDLRTSVALIYSFSPSFERKKTKQTCLCKIVKLGHSTYINIEIGYSDWNTIINLWFELLIDGDFSQIPQKQIEID